MNMATGSDGTSPKAEAMAASDALRRLCGDLVRVMQEPELLACDLYAEGIVPQSALEEMNVVGIIPTQKRMKLLSLVIDQVAVDAERLPKFIQLLKKRPPMVEVAERLERTFVTLREQVYIQPERQSLVQPNTASLAQQPERLQPPGQLVVLPTVPSPQPPPSAHTAIDTYTSFLKSVYRRQKFPTYGKWHPDPAKSFINLALIKKQKMSKEEMDHFMKQTIRGDIDDIVHEKESISMEEVGKEDDSIFPKFILVEGAPGVGKSTFAWKLCRKWSKGKLLQQYRLVVLLRLRDKRVREAKTVSDLFYYYNRPIQQAVVEEIQATGGRGVLLLFEGYDELPAKLRTKNSIFLEVIKGQELPEATVLVTSRPSASGPLYVECRNFIAQHVEILGFAQKDIQSYIQNCIGDDPSLLQGLQQYLTYYPHIRSMLYIPLNCAIVVEVYRVNKRDKSLIPKTWTDLYSSLLRSLLLRYLDDHPVHQRKSWKSNSFRDLPTDVYQQLCELGRIAYEGILQDQQVIFSDLPSDFSNLGLMQCVPELYVDEVAAESFNFLHLTLQEYMAALHLSEQPVEKQIELFQKYVQSPPTHCVLCRDCDDKSNSHFQIVLRFLAGLRKFAGYSISSIKSLLRDNERPSYNSSSTLQITLDGLHWIFEAQETSHVCEAIGMSVANVGLRRTVTSFDCFVLGYCVSHSNCPWEIYLYDCGIGDEEVEMLVRGAVEGEAKHSGYVSAVDIRGNEITSAGFNQLLKIPELLKLRKLKLSRNPLGRGGAIPLLKSPLVDNLEELALADTEIGIDDCHALSELLKIKRLNLSNNPLGRGGAIPLLLKSPLVDNLEDLRLDKTGIGLEDCHALSELLSSSPILQSISIAGNDLPPEAVELIITGLQHNTMFEQLDISGSKFNLHNCISLASVTWPPGRLILEDCGIDDEGAIELGRLIDQNTVTVLYLWGNRISAKGATTIAEMLPRNTSLRELDLRCQSIGLEGTQKLIDSLSQNSTLRKLCLRGRYRSSVETSEVYRRVEDRIKWLTRFRSRRRRCLRWTKAVTTTMDPPPVPLEEDVDMSDIYHIGLGDPTHQPHPPRLGHLPQPWTPHITGPPRGPASESKKAEDGPEEEYVIADPGKGQSPRHLKLMSHHHHGYVSESKELSKPEDSKSENGSNSKKRSSSDSMNQVLTESVLGAVIANPQASHRPSRLHVVHTNVSPPATLEGVDLLDTEEEDWETPPTSPTHPDSATFGPLT